jgi:hypothetical protein
VRINLLRNNEILKLETRELEYEIMKIYGLRDYLEVFWVNLNFNGIKHKIHIIGS